MKDKRSFITIQVDGNVWRLMSNRQRAYNIVKDQLITAGVDPDSCRIRVTNSVTEDAGAYRVFSYGALRDLLNGANPIAGDGVDVSYNRVDLYRLQRHEVNGG
jgi:hypothetical protein